MLFIKDKNKCLDNSYKYQYNGNCYKKCPEDTIEENFICKKIDPQLCTLNQNEFNYGNILSKEGIETMTKGYKEEFIYANNTISEYQNDLYKIFLFKNSSCITELSLKVANIDFGNCYNKVKQAYNINDDLIKAVILNFDTKFHNKPTTSYSFYDPNNGKKLDASNICMNDTIIINENLLSFLDENSTNYNNIKYLLDQNINIFDPNDDFYTNLCIYFETPIKKDIPVKDRLIEFYPNISLCDSGCKHVGINFTEKTAICECKFNDIINNNKANNEITEEYISSITKIVRNSNIEVLKCFKYAVKFFNKSYGGYIILVLFLLSIIFTTIFFILQFSKIKIYIFDLTQNYISLIFKTNNRMINNDNPPKFIRDKTRENNEKEKKNDNKDKRKKSTKIHNNYFSNKTLIQFGESISNTEHYINETKNTNYNPIKTFKKKGLDNSNNTIESKEENINEIFLKIIYQHQLKK